MVPLMPPAVCCGHAHDDHTLHATESESHDQDDDSPTHPHIPYCPCAIALGDVPIQCVTTTVELADLHIGLHFPVPLLVEPIARNTPEHADPPYFQGHCALYISHCALII
jgi:hypothetical protein